MLQLYKNIKDLRKAARLTQEDLAKLTGYGDRSSIARIEKGEIDLPQSKIEQFADALGTTPGELMGWDTDPAEQAKFEVSILTDAELMDMIRTYMKLPEDKKTAVRQLIKTMAD